MLILSIICYPNIVHLCWKCQWNVIDASKGPNEVFCDQWIAAFNDLDGKLSSSMDLGGRGIR